MFLFIRSIELTLNLSLKVIVQILVESGWKLSYGKYPLENSYLLKKPREITSIMWRLSFSRSFRAMVGGWISDVVSFNEEENVSLSLTDPFWLNCQYF